MGSVLTSLVSRKECTSWLHDFPKNISRVSLPYVVLDALGLSCTNGSGVGINAATNGAILFALMALNKAKPNFLQDLMPKLVSDDPATNASVIEYLIINAGLLLVGELASVDCSSEDKSPSEQALCYLTHPTSVFSALKRLKPRKPHSLTCKADEEYDAGLCYPKPRSKNWKVR